MLLERLKRTPGPVGACCNQPVLSLMVFSLSADDALCRAIAEGLNADASIYAAMGAFAANESRPLQNLVYGRRTDPHRLLADAPRQFNQFLDGDFGAVRYEKTAERGGRIVWDNPAESYLSYCLTSLGYFVRLLENSGVAGVTAHNRECRAGGGTRCIWEFGWSAVTDSRRSTQSLRAVQLDEKSELPPPGPLLP